MFCSGAVSLAAFFADSYWMLCGYVVLYGFLDGSFVGLMSLVILEITDEDNLPLAYGTMLTFIGIPIALGPPVIGKVNYEVMISACQNN